MNVKCESRFNDNRGVILIKITIYIRINFQFKSGIMIQTGIYNNGLHRKPDRFAEPDSDHFFKEKDQY